MRSPPTLPTPKKSVRPRVGHREGGTLPPGNGGPKGRYVLKPGDVIATREPGCGGVGEPRERTPDRVLEEVRAGVVTGEGARRDYGVHVDLATGRAWRS